MVLDWCQNFVSAQYVENKCCIVWTNVCSRCWEQKLHCMNKHIFTNSFSMMDGWVRVLRPFNSISVILRPWEGKHERLCAMKRRLGSGRISPQAWFKPATPWSEVWSANRSAMRTFPFLMNTVVFQCMLKNSARKSIISRCKLKFRNYM